MFDYIVQFHSFRSRQNSDLRENIPTDLESVALTTRPRLNAFTSTRFRKFYQSNDNTKDSERHNHPS